MTRPGLVSFGFFVAVGLAWSWPLVLSPADTTVAMQFDQFPAAWLVHAAPSFFPDAVSEWSAWPAGERMTRVDSFIFAAMAVLLQGALPGLLVTNLFVLLGPPISAWAAERFARRALGATFPASLVAGLAFGFAPLALVGVLEGHVYYLLNPWLPLCALAVWEGRSWATVGYWLLSLFTTAYMGVNALVIVLAVLLNQRRLDRRALGGIAAIGVLYAVFFLAGHSSFERDSGDALARLGAASLATLVAWNPWMDLSRHSLAPTIGVAPLCLALLAPLAKVPHTRVLLALGLGTLVLALGPMIEFGLTHEAGVPGPLYPLLELGVFDVYRFPIRFAWTAALMLGSLAALVVSRVRWQWWFVAAGVFDAIVISGAIFRVRAHPVPVPSAYFSLPEGAVLELYPEVGGVQEDLGFYQQNLSCYFQISHRHPIFELCLNTDLSLSPRRAAGRKLHAALLEAKDVRPLLAELHVASVLVHLDLYQSFERSEVIKAMTEAFGMASVESRDGGEWLMAWEVR